MYNVLCKCIIWRRILDLWLFALKKQNNQDQWAYFSLSDMRTCKISIYFLLKMVCNRSIYKNIFLSIQEYSIVCWWMECRNKWKRRMWSQIWKLTNSSTVARIYKLHKDLKCYFIIYWCSTYKCNMAFGNVLFCITT